MTKSAATKKKQPAAKKDANKPRKLNVRQQRFCELVASGETQTEAWLKAGYKVTRGVARRNAAESLTNPVIRKRIADLRAPQTAALALTKSRKHELLREIAENTGASLDARIRAMAEDSKMAGHYEPDRIEVDPGAKTLATIQERARRVASALTLAPLRRN